MCEKCERQKEKFLQEIKLYDQIYELLLKELDHHSATGLHSPVIRTVCDAVNRSAQECVEEALHNAAAQSLFGNNIKPEKMVEILEGIQVYAYTVVFLLGRRSAEAGLPLTMWTGEDAVVEEAEEIAKEASNGH